MKASVKFPPGSTLGTIRKGAVSYTATVKKKRKLTATPASYHFTFTSPALCGRRSAPRCRLATRIASSNTCRCQRALGPAHGSRATTTIEPCALRTKKFGKKRRSMVTDSRCSDRQPTCLPRVADH